MAVRTNQLARGILTVPNVTTLIYTVPANTRTIVKTIQLFNAATAQTAAVGISINYGGPAHGIDTLTVPPFVGAVYERWWVLLAGQRLYLTFSGGLPTPSMHYLASGAELAL